ncbi:hypothetical protein MY04_1497 [Flammeovirga sp. MY04]|uniref:HIRAN domain-containing protein n=1 Tax=Flammeovirga sp. MY04 TaxID=1191459 RepID=UPI00145192D0|nr:HIRAN domain-containing protein [Flammeovirga sp. MY04]ANQ48873.2 hypothetical protein MY04_1497 [Flammeovirga sp. MY04]
MAQPNHINNLVDNVSKELLFEGFLSGFRHYALDDQEWEIMRQNLKLIRHATNPHDENAIAVFANSMMIGYVPKTHSEIIANYIDKGENIIPELIDVNPEATSQEKVYFRIWNYKVKLSS